jgi:RND family efflux transporter MFP subunit
LRHGTLSLSATKETAFSTEEKQSDFSVTGVSAGDEKPMISGRLFIAGVALAGMVCGLVWMQGGFHSKVPAGTTPLPAEKLGAVKTVKAELSRTVGEVTVSGTVVSRDMANVAARIVGNVVELNVDAGDHVKKDQVLLRLETKELKEKEAQAAAALESAKVDLVRTTQDFDRYKGLFETGAVAKKDFDDIKARYEMAQAAEQRAQAALNETQTQLSYSVVTAPFDGVVGSKEVNLGDLVTAGRTLLTVYMPGTLELSAAVGEQYGPYLRPGTAVTVAVESIDLRQASSIREVVPQRDVKTRTITVKAPLAEHPGLVPGLYGSLTFHTRSSEVITIPADAVRTVGQLESVDVLEEGSIRVRHVKIGRKFDDNRVEILSGLEAGEDVVVK